jgi:hypothetical protein
MTTDQVELPDDLAYAMTESESSRNLLVKSFRRRRDALKTMPRNQTECNPESSQVALLEQQGLQN